MYQEHFEELKYTGKLPSPSGVGMRVLVLTQDEDCPMDEVVRTIQADPALTGRIIKLATSVQLASSSRISSAKEASVRLGLRTVCNIALGFTLVSGNRTGRCRRFDYDLYWSLSLANAVAAEVLSKELGIGAPADAFTCALLSKIGRLALASVHPTEYSEVLRQLDENPQLDLAGIEKEHFCIDHREVTAALLEDWGLPSPFSEAALYFDGEEPPNQLEHEPTRDLLRVLNASRVMAEVLVADEGRQPDKWAKLKEICASLEIESTELRRIFDAVVPQWEQWGKLLAVPTNQVLSAEELERRAKEAALRLNEAEPGDGHTGLRILAVDDDPVSLKLLVALLKKAGHQVLTAHNGKEALAVALEMNPQMVVTDWMMPEMDGIELCKQLRRMEAGRKLYILILTGQDEEARIVEAFEAGADDYIVKPFNPKLLMARIRPGVRVILLQEDNDRQVKIKEELNARLSIEKRKLKAAAMTDALTDLPNRRYAMKRLEKEWANGTRSNLPLATIMLDIDHFKVVNDTFGHDVGDTVLQSSARAIQRVLRRGDTCARIGGEEFLVICPNTTPEGAMRVAERIRQTVEENVVKRGEFQGRITISLGVGYRDETTMSIDALLKMADEAVYAAKRAGRNRVALGSPPKDKGKKSA
jgi:two-component system cell cycle response regulator